MREASQNASDKGEWFMLLFAMLRLHLKCPPPNRTCKNQIGFWDYFLWKKYWKTLWIPLDDPFGSLERPVYVFLGTGDPPGTDISPLDQKPYPTDRNSRMSGVSRHSGLSTNQSRSTLAFRSLRNFWVKRHTSNGMRNKQSWYVSLWKKSGSPLEVGRLSHYSQGFLHPWWSRISSINSIMSFF